jgi:hypothetical protein
MRGCVLCKKCLEAVIFSKDLPDRPTALFARSCVTGLKWRQHQTTKKSTRGGIVVFIEGVLTSLRPCLENGHLIW